MAHAADSGSGDGEGRNETGCTRADVARWRAAYKALIKQIEQAAVCDAPTLAESERRIELLRFELKQLLPKTKAQTHGQER